jgi:hypothetical protein
MSPHEDFAICDHPYLAKMHRHAGACQICYFKLSEAEKAQFERAGRHLRVSITSGGCADCQVFPSLEGEDPVRLCKQCFFDNHLVAPRAEEAFAGPGAFVGATDDRRTPRGLSVFLRPAPR